MHEQQTGANPGGTGGSGTASEAAEPLKTVPLANHQTTEFRCARSERINAFFRAEAPPLIAARYCRVFVLPDPADESRIWGFYTLSAASLSRGEYSTQDQKRIPRGLPVPLALIGYMGRHDSAPKGVGAALVIDAARRAYRNQDLGAAGLLLRAEGGSDSPTLMAWYKSVGFTESKNQEGPQNGLMYGPFRRFLPELKA